MQLRKLKIGNGLLLMMLGWCLLAVSGCGSGDYASNAISTANQRNVQRLANLYDRYQTSHRWFGPKNQEDFQVFIESLDDKTLNRMGVERSAIDQLFVSERDGQPFTIKFRQRGSSRGGPKPVIFEKDGVDGKREVGFTRMIDKLVDDAEYKELLASK